MARKSLTPSPWQSRGRVVIGVVLIGLIVILDAAFAYFVLGYIYGSPSALNPNPSHSLDIPIRFDYYQNISSPSSINAPGDFEFALWLTGKTPVQNTVVAGHPFTLSGRAYMPHPKVTGRNLNDTRLITIFFQHVLSSPAKNDTHGLPFGGVADICREGADCVCPAQGICAMNLFLSKQSSTFWSLRNDTFYFPISGQFSPVLQFFTIGPNNATSLLATATSHQIGDITLDVQPASIVQETYIGNASLVLSMAVFFFGLIESADAGWRIFGFWIWRKKKES